MAKNLLVLVLDTPMVSQQHSAHLSFLEVDGFFRDSPSPFPAKATSVAPLPDSMLEPPLALAHREQGVNGNAALKVISPLLKNPQPKQCNSVGK